ncbi:MAG: hypothetical protein EHM37_19315 [Deltaproteobacteria bacterium]|nr:MAG: hypothetical protein EHM37_19315 [Deltaproteobacteria bacterium]
MSKYYITSGVAIEELVIGEKLGASDAGNVFAIIAPLQLADSVAKIYLNPKAFDAEKIGTLVEKVPSQLWAVLASGAVPSICLAATYRLCQISVCQGATTCRHPDAQDRFTGNRYSRCLL